MPMHDDGRQSPVSESNDIPLFYLGGDPAAQCLAKNLGGAHRFHRLSIDESVVRELKNPYSLRCIAEYFASVVRENRARGPYMLGGWCAQGVLALETAQILGENESVRARAQILALSAEGTCKQVSVSEGRPQANRPTQQSAGDTA